MNNKYIRILVSLITLILLTFIIGRLYIFFEYHYLPKRQLIKTLNEFDRICREDDNFKIKETISGNSYIHLDIDDFIKTISKFKPGVKVVWANKATMNDSIYNNKQAIFGDIKMIANIDNKSRLFSGVTIIFENNKWKVDAFYFPDFIDY